MIYPRGGLLYFSLKTVFHCAITGFSSSVLVKGYSMPSVWKRDITFHMSALHCQNNHNPQHKLPLHVQTSSFYFSHKAAIQNAQDDDCKFWLLYWKCCPGCYISETQVPFWLFCLFQSLKVWFLLLLFDSQNLEQRNKIVETLKNNCIPVIVLILLSSNVHSTSIHNISINTDTCASATCQKPQNRSDQTK